MAVRTNERAAIGVTAARGFAPQPGRPGRRPAQQEVNRMMSRIGHIPFGGAFSRVLARGRARPPAIPGDFCAPYRIGHWDFSSKATAERRMRGIKDSARLDQDLAGDTEMPSPSASTKSSRDWPIQGLVATISRSCVRSRISPACRAGAPRGAHAVVATVALARGARPEGSVTTSHQWEADR
jgi:hypothetical protein